MKSRSTPSPYPILTPLVSYLSNLPALCRGRRLHVHHREIGVAAVGHRVQQLGAGGEPARHHQQDHGADLGLLRRHLPGLLHRQPGRLHDPGGVHRHRVRPLRQQGK